MARGRGRPAAGERKLIGTSVTLTTDQLAWLRAKAQASGIASVGGFLRSLVQQAIDSERNEQAAAS